MNEKILKGKLILGNEVNLTIIKDFKPIDINTNFLVYEDFSYINLMNSKEIRIYKDDYDSLLELNNENLLIKTLSKELKRFINTSLKNNPNYCRDVETYLSNVGNLNLVDSKTFYQLTLDNQNDNILMSFKDLEIKTLKTNNEYYNYSKNINILSTILEDNLGIKIQDACIYFLKENSDKIYFSLYSEEQDRTIFVGQDFLNNFSNEYIKELELEKNKLPINVTPCKENDEDVNNLLEFVQKRRCLDSILKSLKDVDNGDIFLDISGVYKLMELGEIVITSTNPVLLPYEIGVKIVKDGVETIVVDKISKEASDLLGIDNSLIKESIEIVKEGPENYGKEKIEDTKIRINKRQKEKIDEDLDF